MSFSNIGASIEKSTVQDDDGCDLYYIKAKKGLVTSCLLPMTMLEIYRFRNELDLLIEEISFEITTLENIDYIVSALEGT